LSLRRPSPLVSPRDDFPTFGDSVSDKFVHAFSRRSVDQRTQHDMATRIAGRQGGCALCKFRDEDVRDRRVDNDPLGRHANLALVGEGAEYSGVDRRVEIGVVEYDERRLSAELEQDWLQVLGGEPGNDLPDLR
jgi:hypothetical protein